MTEQFDLLAACQARDEGIRRVAENNQEFLVEAREVALRIAKRKGTVTADEVRRECELTPLHPNAYGAIFKSPKFKWTGSYRRSALVQGHGNLQRVWTFK
jgi:hypothetical protein